MANDLEVGAKHVAVRVVEVRCRRRLKGVVMVVDVRCVGHNGGGLSNFSNGYRNTPLFFIFCFPCELGDKWDSCPRLLCTTSAPNQPSTPFSQRPLPAPSTPPTSPHHTRTQSTPKYEQRSPRSVHHYIHIRPPHNERSRIPMWRLRCT